MAASLVESLGADFDATDFHDEYREAVGRADRAEEDHGRRRGRRRWRRRRWTTRATA